MYVAGPERAAESCVDCPGEQRVQPSSFLLALPRADLWPAASLELVIQGKILVVTFVTHFQY